MKIEKIHIENFKRISSLDVSPGTHLFVVGGKNGNGKSSLLDAVAVAFGGKKALPDRPVRDGAETGEIVIRLDSGHVIRSDLRGGVTVGKDVDGRLAKLSSPQALLSAMAGSLAMDPLAFMRMPSKDQAAKIRELTGCDTSRIELEIKAAFDGRAEANRALESIVAQLSSLPPANPDAPAEPVDTAALAAQLAEESKKTDSKRRAEAEAEKARASADLAERKVEAAREALRRAEADAEKANALAHQATVQASAMPDGDTSEITAKLAGASEHNRAYEAERTRSKRAAELAASREQAATAAAELDAMVRKKREERLAMISAAKMPVDGLSFDRDGLTFGGVPLAQASSAEQLRVSLAVASALAPQLRTVLIREGSLLDDDSLAAVASFCEEHDLQVLMERVGTGEECSIIMHDGRVAS